jgi:ABC-2 type transport system permease protein
MRHFFILFRHEVRMLLLNPSSYISAMLFLVCMGFIFMGILEEYARAAQDTSPAIAFFSLFFLACVMVPLLTMKSIAEERRSGTLETLLSAPVNTTVVVLAKFSASYTLYLLQWAFTVGFVFILHHFARDPRLLDPGPLVGGYVFIAVTGLLYVAIGTLASALVRSQAAAGIIGFAAILVAIFGARMTTNMTLFQQESFQAMRDSVASVDVFHHLSDFTRGVVDTRQIIFYFTGTSLALILSILGMEAKILRS